MRGEGPFRAEELGEGRGGDPGGWRRTLRAQAAQSHQSAGRADRPATASCSGRRGRRAAASPRGRRRRRRTGGPGAEEIEAAQSLPAFRSTSPASSRGDPERLERAAACPPPSPLGALGLVRPARGPPTRPHSDHPQPTPSPGPLFQPRSPAPGSFLPQGLGVLDSSFPDQSFLIKRPRLGVGGA